MVTEVNPIEQLPAASHVRNLDAQAVSELLNISEDSATLLMKKGLSGGGLACSDIRISQKPGVRGRVVRRTSLADVLRWQNSRTIETNKRTGRKSVLKSKTFNPVTGAYE